MAQIILHAALRQQVKYTIDREKERERESDIVKETVGRGAPQYVNNQSKRACLQHKSLSYWQCTFLLMYVYCYMCK